MYKFFSASSSPLVYSAALLASCCILFNPSLQVNCWALTSPKGQKTSHNYLYLSFQYVTVLLPVPQALVNLVKSFSDRNPALPKL